MQQQQTTTTSSSGGGGIEDEGELISLGDREHLLLRPDTFCGSTRLADHPASFVFDAVAEAVAEATAPKKTQTTPLLRDDVVARTRTLVYAPAVRSLFQEILTNALDRQFRDDTMRSIEVWIDSDDAGGPGWIRVRNDGVGIPVVFDDARAAWKPTIAFSHFRSGTNFVDGGGGGGAPARWTAGRNGYGCKATNVFSAEFRVHTADPRSGKVFKQTFSENMAVAGPVEVKAFKLKRGFTDVAFKLDLARLGNDGGGGGAATATMTDDVRHMLRASTVLAAACLVRTVSLSLNGTRLHTKNLRSFASVFVKPDIAVAYDVVHSDTHRLDVWEVCAVAADATVDGVADTGALGFVNSMHCSQGTHVNFALARLTTALEDAFRIKFKKPGDFSLSVALVRRHVFLVVKLMLDSPEFSSQTKEKLTTPAAKFGPECSTWQPSAAFLKALTSGGVLAALHEDVSARELGAARRSISSRTSTAASSSATRRKDVVADKYDAATNATRAGSTCSLLVTEGDSARALAVAGLAVLGRANYGIFALKGKPLNVRNATVDAISKNKEMSTLLNILGLTLGKTYASLDALNYKKLVIFSDQDPDGAHIGGLLINVIDALFPSVLALDPAFVQRFPTPLVRVTERADRGGSGGGGVHAFYAKTHFDAWWRAQTEQTRKRCAVKYFKGLGTSTSALAREYFSRYAEQLVDIRATATSAALMAQMFQNDNAADRKLLLTNHFDPRGYVDYSVKAITLDDFVHKEVLPYSNYSNERNIPHVLDGLKPVQRKALFTFFEKNLVADVKVAQVAAVVAAHTAYHHGEASLVETVVGMAQDHVFVSNVNLFRPEGQFGSRLDAPSVHSAARYIFTGLDPVARALFPADDDSVLARREDEGAPIEPEAFVPVIPMVLVNGAFGIGTGWSSSVPMYNPRDVLAVCRLYAAGTDGARAAADALVPWYDGFTGTIECHGDDVFRTRGRLSVDETKTKIHITELPVGAWTHAFVERLEQKLMDGSPSPSPSLGRKCKAPGGGDADGGLILNIEKRWTESKVDMVLHCSAPAVEALMARDQLWTTLGMQTDVRTSNMHLYDASGALRHFARVRDIFDAFAAARVATYTRRKARMVADLEHDIFVLHNKIAFVTAVTSGAVRLHDLPSRDGDGDDDDALARVLESHGLARVGGDFGYLVNMSLRSLTRKRTDALRAELGAKERALTALRAKDERALWLDDLDAAERALGAFAARKAERYSSSSSSGGDSSSSSSSTTLKTKHKAKAATTTTSKRARE